MCAALAGTPVVAPACHDTGSAVAAVFAGGRTAFLSSGTWSLLGTELPAPVDHAEVARSELHQRRRRLRHDAAAEEHRRPLAPAGVPALVGRLRSGLRATKGCSARPPRSATRSSRSSIRITAASSSRPTWCRRSPITAGRRDSRCRRARRRYARAILESLAFKYRVVLESLEELTGTRFEEIRIVGGGSRNRLLNQFTADATGRTVVAGPVEATALGNIAMQMLATGAVGSLDDARAVIERSFPVERFEPAAADVWDSHYARFLDYVEMTCV